MIFLIMNFIKSFNQKLLNLIAFDFLVLFIIRMYLAFIFWFAGYGKINWKSGSPNIDKFAEFLGSGGQDNLNFIAPYFFGWLAVFAEAGGAILLLVGLFSRWAALPLIITMLVATYYHSPNGWNADASGYEMSVTYIIMLMTVLIFGPGKYFSLDYWILRK